MFARRECWDGPADIRLAEFVAALSYGRDQRITEAAAPIAAGLSGRAKQDCSG
jgi:hypothetical protein